MGNRAKGQTQTGEMAQIAAWATGIGITLVEMQWGMDYVLAHVKNHMSMIVGWLPTLATLVEQIWR